MAVLRNNSDEILLDPSRVSELFPIITASAKLMKINYKIIASIAKTNYSGQGGS
jgi:hypothetical protein